MLLPDDPRLAFWSPQPVSREAGPVRVERIPRAATALLAGQIGPLANLRSSTGCALCLVCDAPWVDVHLDRLRHHQPFPQRLSVEIEHEPGQWTHGESRDLRAEEGAVVVRLATGLERGTGLRPVWLWLPPISTCAVAGIDLPAGTALAAPQLPEPAWLAIGDSLTQGFSVASTVETWVQRAARQLRLPAWNLGVGGLLIEPELFAPLLRERRFALVTVGLGSNHAWRARDLDTLPQRARALAEQALAGGHGRVLWLMPPWKPCEDGLGPTHFAGVALDGETATRLRLIRSLLHTALEPFAPQLEIVADLMPHDARLLPDGLHPEAHGAAQYAAAFMRRLAGAGTAAG